MSRFKRTFLIYNDHDHDQIIHDHDNVHAGIKVLFTIDGVPLQEGLTPLVQVSFIRSTLFVAIFLPFHSSREKIYSVTKMRPRNALLHI